MFMEVNGNIMIKGSKHSEESRKKMSAAAKNRNKGCHWWSNGKVYRFTRECPGEEFHLSGPPPMKEQALQDLKQRMKGNKYAVADWNWWDKG